MNHQAAENTPRPWLRFWARYIDLLLGGSLFGILLVYIGAPFSNKYVMTCMMSTFLWIPFESMMLSTYGTTPGKWLLHITVRDFQGKIPTFRQCLKRSLFVWSWGLGIGFVYATWVGMLFSYLDLKDKGMTKWDKQGNFQISHKEIGMHRGLAILFLIFCFIFMVRLFSTIITETLLPMEYERTAVFAGMMLLFCVGIIAYLQFENKN